MEEMDKTVITIACNMQQQNSSKSQIKHFDAETYEFDKISVGNQES